MIGSPELVSLEYSWRKANRRNPKVVYTNKHTKAITYNIYRIPYARILKLRIPQLNCVAQEELDGEAWQHNIIRSFRQAPV